VAGKVACRPIVWNAQRRDLQTALFCAARGCFHDKSFVAAHGRKRESDKTSGDEIPCASQRLGAYELGLCCGTMVSASDHRNERAPGWMLGLNVGGLGPSVSSRWSAICELGLRDRTAGCTGSISRGLSTVKSHRRLGDFFGFPVSVVSMLQLAE